MSDEFGMPTFGATQVGQEPDGLSASEPMGDHQVIVERGKPTTAFTGGATITLTPCDKDGTTIDGMADVVCHLAPDKTFVGSNYDTTIILAFSRYEGNDGAADGVLVGSHAPGGTKAMTGRSYWFDVTGDPGAPFTIDSTADFLHRQVWIHVLTDSGAPLDNGSWGSSDVTMNLGGINQDDSPVGILVNANVGLDGRVFKYSNVALGDFTVQVDLATENLEVIAENFASRYQIRFMLLWGNKVTASEAVDVS